MLLHGGFNKKKLFKNALSDMTFIDKIIKKICFRNTKL